MESESRSRILALAVKLLQKNILSVVVCSSEIRAGSLFVWVIHLFF